MIATKLPPEEIEGFLAKFCGTENYYKHWLPGFRFTDGVKGMADLCGAYWLIDLVVSHQRGKLRLAEFQIWILDVADDLSEY